MAVHLKHLLYCLLALLMLVASPAGGLAQATRTPAQPQATFLPLVFKSIPPEWIGPGGGLVSALAIYPPDPRVIYAGSWGGGVYKSTDGGLTWAYKSLGITNLTIVSLAVDPSNPNIAYAGTYRGKLFKTKDGGQIWVSSSQGIQNNAIVYSIAIDPWNAHRIYIATRGYAGDGKPPWKGVIYRSENGGASWEHSLEDLGGDDYQDYVYSLTIHPQSPNIIFAATHEHGIYRSTNSGDSWKEMNNGITNYSTRAVVAGPDGDQRENVYTGVWERKGVFKSDDLGKQWAQSSDGIEGAHIYSMDGDAAHPAWVYAGTFNMGVVRSTNAAKRWSKIGLNWESIASVRVSPLDGNTIFAGTAGDGLFASRDAGATWGRSQAGLNASSVTDLVVSPDDPHTYYAGVYGSGVMRSTDSGATWQVFRQNMSTTLVNRLVRQPGQPVLYALTGSNDLYRCDLHDSGNCWQRVGTNLPTALPPNAPASLGKPASSGGAGWETFFREASGNPEGTSEAALAAPNLALTEAYGLLAMAFAPSDPQVAYLGTHSSGVYRSLDGGLSWAPAGLPEERTWALAVDPAHPETVYAADGNGAAWMSNDAGASWGEITLPGAVIYSLAIPPTNPGLLYAGTNLGIYARFEGSWTPLGLAGSSIGWVTVDPVDERVIYAGSTDGAFISRDAGATWEKEPANLEGYSVQSITIDPFDPQVVYFSTTSRGVLKCYIP